MKHRNGTEYALCPKVATEEMVHAAGCGLDYPSVYMGGPRDQSKRAGRRAAEAAIAAAPAYEPSEEDVERVMAGINGVQLFSRYIDLAEDREDGKPIEICRHGEEGEPEIVVVERYGPEWAESTALRHTIAKYRARAAIRAFLGDE